ncbi:transposase, IS4 family protein [Candidatus Moduliflexus flocculans]|uniref:Transposase, IS4 family protein n=1 Tax=Candidatus Moduliflexus flocculans TaxID=1499966 RepID=A0A081BMQ9_9BACT|nr:transposase, IS4 family protein [Candidatus Moduliflexus flocculans]
MSKKTIAAIIDSGNDYLIQVKGNQPTLFRTIKASVESQEALSMSSREERSRGRHERRTVAVFVPPASLVEQWNGLCRVIHVERHVVRGGKNTRTDHYYISSVCSNQAEVFGRGIRGHWSIENRLHWVKDVLQHEDDSGIKKGNGVETLSILKNIAINLSRELGFDSIKGAAIHFASNVKELLKYFRT